MLHTTRETRDMTQTYAVNYFMLGAEGGAQYWLKLAARGCCPINRVTACGTLRVVLSRVHGH